MATNSQVGARDGGDGDPHCATHPPSTGNAVPVIDWPPSEQEEKPQELRVLRRCCSSTTLLGWAESKTCSITLAGRIRAPWRCRRSDFDQQRPDIAGADSVAGDPELRAFERDCLSQPYNAVLGGNIGALRTARRTTPCAEATLMTRPQAGAAFIRTEGGADGVERRGQVRRDDRVHFSVGKSSIGLTCWMPALLTRMSRRPKLAIAFQPSRPPLRGPSDWRRHMLRAHFGRGPGRGASFQLRRDRRPH